jgi:hypothetical protein
MALSCLVSPPPSKQHHPNLEIHKAMHWLNQHVGRALNTPNTGLLLTTREMNHRAFYQQYAQSDRVRHLTDAEIRDFFSDASQLSVYNRSREPYQNPVAKAYANGNKNRPNNIMYIALRGDNTPCDHEWVTMNGPHGYTNVHFLTTQPMQALSYARRLLLHATPDDLLWIVRYDSHTRKWCSLNVYNANEVRLYILRSGWPFHRPTSHL